MLSAENEDPESLEVTPLDAAKIDDLEIGEKMESETGTFSVLRYKSEYLLMEQVGKEKTLTFKNLKQLKHFLEMW